MQKHLQETGDCVETYQTCALPFSATNFSCAFLCQASCVTVHNRPKESTIAVVIRGYMDESDISTLQHMTWTTIELHNHHSIQSARIEKYTPTIMRIVGRLVARGTKFEPGSVDVYPRSLDKGYEGLHDSIDSMSEDEWLNEWLPGHEVS
jgi:hypothetical protein